MILRAATCGATSLGTGAGHGSVAAVEGFGSRGLVVASGSSSDASAYPSSSIRCWEGVRALNCPRDEIQGSVSLHLVIISQDS